MAAHFFLWASVALITGLEATYLPQLHEDGIHSIAKRDPCNGFGASPELGVTYRQADCPALQEFLPDGACDYTKRQVHDTQCAFFCQVGTTFEYMTEKPLENTYCRGPRTCMINQDKLVYTGYEWGGSGSWAWAFDHGISGGFNGAANPIMAGPGEIPIADNECGYFTYVGIQKTVCGTLTEAQKHTDENGTYCVDPQTTTGNVCVSDIATSSGNPHSPPQGHTVFVRTDCATREPLDAARQDPVYRRGSARMEAGALDAALQAWVRTSCNVYYKFLFNAFDVRGRGFKDALVGPALDGGDLKRHIQHCGEVTSWGFEYTPNDPDYDWHAWGRTPIGTKSCIGSAVEAVGGTADNCVGSG
ncbi:hypothetical protein F5X99DRAFT_424618 [Biscogniauxia marginata]|nr:hypothetical protein F5X99DRAFT_424618 [Biscogniauxia marginata]